MKNLRIFILIIALISISSIILFHKNNKTAKYKPNKEQKQKEDANGALKYLAALRNNPKTGTFDYSDVERALNGINALNKNKANDEITWEELGPNDVGGRTRAILIDRNNNNVIYAGGVSGGLWKSDNAGASWRRILLKSENAETVLQNISVSSIAQAPNGYIYVGTGEYFAYSITGVSTFTTGFMGKGMFRSTDGENFLFLTSTTPTSTKTEWQFINKLVCNPSNGWVFAATHKGLFVSKDNGDSWALAFGGPSHIATDIEIHTDLTTVASIDKKCYISTQGGEIGTFVLKSTGLPKINELSRIEFAIAPSNSSYIYATAANGGGWLRGIYRSVDKGETWSQIGPGRTDSKPLDDFNVFSYQGFYDNEVAVFPDDPDRILVGGVDVWEWKLGQTWKKRSAGSWPIHSDIHKIVFHPSNFKIFYIGTDGGIYRTTDGGETFDDMNKNYNVTQFYAIAVSGNGEVMGGTQDNGSQYINYKGNTKQSSWQVLGGDGGYAAFSLINPDAMFGSIYYGNIYRRSNKIFISQNPDQWSQPTDWMSPDDWFDARMKALRPVGGDFPAPFVTPLLFWESFNDNLTQDFVVGKALQDIPKGLSIQAASKNNGFRFDYTLTRNLKTGDTVHIKDKVQSMFFAPFQNMVWMTRGALQFAKAPKWFKVASGLADASGGFYPNCLAITKDGNHLFIGSLGGAVYRISNLRFAYDMLSADVDSSNYYVVSKDKIRNFPGRAVTSIAVDPQNSNHIIVTLGNYGQGDYVYETNNALDSVAEFKVKQGNLPLMPIYSSLIEMKNPNIVLVGTEYGIFATNNINVNKPTWAEENLGYDRVGTFMLKQQSNYYDGDYVPTGSAVTPYARPEVSCDKNVNNYGSIYVASYGRGFFKSDKYKITVPSCIEGVKNVTADNTALFIRLNPNPAKDYANINIILTKKSDALIHFYDMKGQIVKSINLNNYSEGKHIVNFDCSSLKAGTYIVKLKTSDKEAYSKFIISK